MPLQHKQLKLICVTSGRSDVFIWLPVWRAIVRNPKFELWIARTGMHISASEKTNIDKLIDANIIDVGFDLGGNKPEQASEAMAESAAGFCRVFNEIKPDALFVLGDRMDMLPAVFASLPFNIMCIHLHGGEISEGAIDDRIRHAVSMMSSIHFVAHTEAKAIIEGFGKKSSAVYVVGAPGLDNIKSSPFISKEDLLTELGVSRYKDFFVGTVHSETNSSNPVRPLLETLKAIEQFSKCETIFTHSNSDPCNMVINDLLQKADNDIPHFHFFPSLRYEQYVNLMRHSVAVIGNSSSGLIEAPFLKKRVLNIGARQLGRVADKHVRHCSNESEKIFAALDKLFSEKNSDKMSSSSIYGRGDASEKIEKILDRLF